MKLSSRMAIALPAALAVAVLGSSAHPGPTTTAEVGDVADFLFQRATCKDFTSALRKEKDPSQTTEEILIVMLGLAYNEGFASGTGRGRDARADMIVRCAMNPDARFNNIDD